MNGKVQFTQQEWKDLVENELDDNGIDGRMMCCLARLPDMMHRGRDALNDTQGRQLALLELREEMLSLRDDSRAIIEGLRDRSCAIDAKIASGDWIPTGLAAIAPAHCSSGYGLGLAAGVLINCVLGSLGTNDIDLREESGQMAAEIVRLAGILTKYQPLASASMVICLGAAWVGVTDAFVRERTQELLADYVTTFSTHEVFLSTADLEYLVRRFTLQE